MVVYIREVLDDSWCKGTGGTLRCPDMVADWGKLKILEQ